MPSTDKVVTQGDVHEEIDLSCNLNVEDLKNNTPFASTREHVLVFGGVTGTIALEVPEEHERKRFVERGVCLLKEHRHWPLQNQARGSRLGLL